MVSAGGPARPAAQAHGHGAAAPAPAADLIPDVRHTIAVSPGKGGVGKSTVAVNLAIAAPADGRVGGSDRRRRLRARRAPHAGRQGQAGHESSNRIIPVHAHGLAMMSIGLLVSDREPLVWRGPMIHSFIQQMLRDVMWGALTTWSSTCRRARRRAALALPGDSPGRGGMVTTPQDVALLDVRKAIGMFQRLNVPILGVVENMSYFVAPDTGTRYPIFGEGGGQRVADEYGVPLLAQIPLDPAVREGVTRVRPSPCAGASRRRPPASAPWRPPSSGVSMSWRP